LFEDEIENSAKQKTDAKTRLQQLAEQDGSAILEYKTILEEGPEHNKRFTVAAYINNNEVGRGRGRTKKLAEMQAAKMALKLFGVSV
jgi:ribonuclease-3